MILPVVLINVCITISLMTTLFSPSNTNIINGNYSLRHRRICGLCSFLNPNSALDKYGIDVRIVSMVYRNH